MVAVRPLAPGDLPAATALWNAAFPFDEISPDRLASVSLADVTTAPDGALGAFDGPLVGLALAGRGADALYLKGFAFAPDRADAGDALLGAVERLARNRGAARLEIRGGGAGPYLTPAVDERYAALLAFLRGHGFTDLETLQDAEVDLAAWTPNVRQLAYEARLGAAGISARRFTPDLVPAAKAFVDASGRPDWFADGWAAEWTRGAEVIVAVEHGAVIAYARYAPGPEWGEFGPALTLPDRNDQGIGTVVLLETMRALKAAGTSVARASWVWPPEFYLKSGWRISRRYVAMVHHFL